MINTPNNRGGFISRKTPVMTNIKLTSGGCGSIGNDCGNGNGNGGGGGAVGGVGGLLPLLLPVSASSPTKIMLTASNAKEDLSNRINDFLDHLEVSKLQLKQRIQDMKHQGKFQFSKRRATSISYSSSSPTTTNTTPPTKKQSNNENLLATAEVIPNPKATSEYGYLTWNSR